MADLSHPPKKKARVLTNTGPFPRVALLLESVIHQEATQLLTPRRMPQLAQCLSLYLPNPLTSHIKLLTHLFQSVVGIHINTKPHTEDLSLPRGQLRKCRVSGLAQRLHRSLVARGRHGGVLD